MYLKDLVPLLPTLEQHTLFQSDAHTTVLNENTGAKFTLRRIVQNSCLMANLAAAQLKRLVLCG